MTGQREEGGNVVDMQTERRHKRRRQEDAAVSDDKVELIQALIEAERRKSEALIDAQREAFQSYKEIADARFGRLEEVQGKMLRRLVMWAGVIVGVGLMLGFVGYVLEFIGPTAIRAWFKS